jgi:hypothetical protein
MLIILKNKLLVNNTLKGPRAIPQQVTKQVAKHKLVVRELRTESKVTFRAAFCH